MTRFKYSAAGPEGMVNGEIDAADRMEAFLQLARQRLHPLHLEESEGRKFKEEPGTVQKEIRLKHAQILQFTEELGELLAAGIQLEPALAAMEKRREMSAVKGISRALRAHLRDGVSFSRALSLVSRSFGGLYCALVSAGEASGALPLILKRQAIYLRSVSALRNKVLFALIYPSFLIVSAILVTVLFVVYLIPKLTLMLDATGASLPMGAQIVLAISDAVKAGWWLVLGTLFGGIGLFKLWLSKPESALPFGRFVLRIPLFGPMLRAQFYVQFLETLSNLAGSGLPIIQALGLTTGVADNAYLRQSLEQVSAMVRDGLSLSRALERSGEFPPLLLDMVIVGEHTGNLPSALSHAAERYHRDMSAKVERLTSLIQPVIVCLMAGLVGVMAYLMVTTIFQTISGLGSH
jgi:type II secretory pathway component PulF